MSEPKYLGHVRFGAGPDCPCGGDRRIKYRKVHHGWFFDANFNAFPTRSTPKIVPLTMQTEGFVPGASGEDRNGINIIDRFTGRTDGPFFVLSTLTIIESLIAYSEGHGTYSRPASPDPDVISHIYWTNLYPFALLAADLEAAIANPQLSIGYVPDGQTWEAGYAELDSDLSVDGITTSRWDPEGRPWVGSAPADGRPVMAFSEPDTGIFNTGFSRETDIASRFGWGDQYLRDRLQVQFQGFYSLERRVELHRQGAAPEITTQPREYYYLERGILDIISPPITDAQAQSVDREVISAIYLRIGDTPPDGTPYTTVQGSGAGGTSC